MIWKYEYLVAFSAINVQCFCIYTNHRALSLATSSAGKTRIQRYDIDVAEMAVKDTEMMEDNNYVYGAAE